MGYLLVAILSASATYAAGEWACARQPVELKAAREAYHAKIADGPLRDRLLVTVDKMQQELDRQNALHRQRQVER